MGELTARPKSAGALGWRSVKGIVGAVFLLLAAIFGAVGLVVGPVRAAFLPLAVAFAAAGGVLAVLARRDGARKRRLAETGRAVEGEALGFRSTLVRINSVSQYQLRYGFEGPDGVRREGWGAHRRPEDVVTVEKGSVVHVLVDPEDPENHALARDLLEVEDVSGHG